MYLKRDKKECSIYNKFFIDDLEKYEIVEDVTIDSDSTLYLRFLDSYPSSTCSIRSADLLTIINSNRPDSPKDDIWLPAILDTNTYMSSKEVLMGHVIDNTVYGIESMLSLSNPVFQNWTIDTIPIANQPSIDIDWKLNSNLSPVEIFYGPLFWYKKNTDPSSSTTFKLKEIPNGSKIYCTQQLSYTINSKTYTIPANQIVVKKNNALLKLIKKTEVESNNNSEWFEFSKMQNLEDSRIFKVFGLYNTISSGLKDYTLWISSGEVFSYYNGHRDRYKRDQNGTLSRSYLSPSLYRIYRSIYNALTIREKKISSGFSLNKIQSAKLKKLCYFLASSPLIDGTTIDYLTAKPLYDRIYNEYIKAASGTNEKKDLLNIINTIFYSYRNISVDFDQQTTGHNIVKTKTDLFLKLSKKYTPYIRIASPTTSCKFTYKSSLFNGAHAYFNFGTSSHIPFSTTTTTTIFNNFDLTLGNIKLQTNNSLTNSECKFFYVNDDDTTVQMTGIMPLCDIAFKKPDKIKINLGNDANISMGDAYEKTHTIPEISSTTTTDTSTFWFLSEGYDCLRFSDNNRFPGRGSFLNRLRTSTEDNPDIFVKKPGVFSVDCVHSESSALKKSDTIDICVDGGTPLGYPTDNRVINEYKSMCPNIRQVGINKRGLVWFMDTDMHICKVADPTFFSKEKRCINTKIGLEYFYRVDSDGDMVANIYNSDASLKFNFSPNNTIIKLSHLSIEHLRDRDTTTTKDGITRTANFADCKSCYEEKIVREPDDRNTEENGVARYYRIGTDDSVSLYKYTTNNNIDWNRSSEVVEFKLPPASTAFSPKIPSYGGYSQQVIKNIGVDIPYHPINVGGNPMVYKETPAGTFWDCPGGFACHEPAYMPPIIDRNDMGGQNSNRRCRLVDIPVTGCTTFSKGYFHTRRGWIPHTSESYENYYTNKSSVQKYQTDDYESYIFKGHGYLDLKSSFGETTNFKNNFKSRIEINSYSVGVGASQFNPNYGYRNPNLTILEETDDFIVSQDTESMVDFNCDFVPTMGYSFISSSKLGSLTIKDLEVKLNFINYPNPKQLIVYLDVNYNGTVTEDATGKIFKNYLSASDVSSGTPSGFSAYYSSIVSLNAASPSVGGKRLYLLNRDSIDNYGYNFNICFTDNVGINHVTTDYNKITSGVLSSQYVIHNNDKIRPTLSPFNYDDTEIAMHRNVLANNNMSILEASFAKFRNIPLAGAKFTLNVEVVDQHDAITVKDNLKNNNELSGLANIENKETSNNIANSICSWEIVVHTKSVKKFVPSDVLGYINYNNPATGYDGYSFIADLTDKKYMIPPVNLNAPFPYLSNINSCKFIDDYEQSRGMTYQKIEYPTTFLYFTPFFSAVGGLVAISQLNAVFGAGGRADPIVNMFLDLSFQRQQEEKERSYFQPVYDGFGYANKAIILASKDKAIWYQMEVPIFKYSNCPILEQNKYKYIKLKKQLALGRFIVKRVTSIREIIDTSQIAATTDTSNFSGLSVTTTKGTSLTLQDGDLVHVKNSTTNDIYAVSSGGWTLAPNTNSSKFCSYNKAIKNTTLTKAYIGARQLFMVDGARAYYYFDKRDNIDMRYMNAGSSGTNTILDKALLLINGEYKTVLTLSATVDAEIGEIAKPDSDVNTILIYKDHVTRKDNIKVGKWSTNKSYNEKALNFQIDRHPAVFGEGSIGYGTNEIEPQTLEGINLKFNSIEDTNKILDGNNSNKFRYNTVTVNGADITFDPAEDEEQDLLYGYSYSIFDFGLHKPEALINPFKDNQKDLLDINELEKIAAAVNSNLLVSHNNQNPLFMDLKSDKFKDIADSGEIIIDRDFTTKISTYSLSNSQTGVIALRIAKLIDLIAQAKTTYDNMDDDQQACESADGINAECPKKEKLQEIKAYTTEKDSLRSILANAGSRETYSSKSISFVPGLSESLTAEQVAQAKILMNTKTPSSTKAELLTALGIDEEAYDTLIALAPNNKITASFREIDYYWINIDKEQYCSISQEVSAKVLSKVTYECSPIAGYYQYPACNSVCGSNSSKDLNNGTDQNIKQDAIKVEYSISDAQKAIEKAKYPAVTEWVNNNTNNSTGYYEFEKKFFMSCGDDTGGDGSGKRDTLVTVKEYYEYPKKPAAAASVCKVKDCFNLDSDNTVYIKFKNIPRKLKTIDLLFDLYNYDYNGNLGKSITPSPGGAMSNNFCVWQCYGFDDDKPQPDGNEFYGKQIEPPDFYKLQNEMIFRAFFGSVDGTEHRNTNISDTKEMWEWIPYEYFNKPIIEPP